MAENDARKQGYLASRFPNTVLFNDVTETVKPTARLWDGMTARVPQARGLVGRFILLLLILNPWIKLTLIFSRVDMDFEEGPSITYYDRHCYPARWTCWLGGSLA